MTPWQCRCNERGAASSDEAAFLEWLIHHNLTHDGRLTAEGLENARRRSDAVLV